MPKKYPAQKGRLYTEKLVDSQGREYQNFVSWNYSPPKTETSQEPEEKTEDE